MNKIIIAEINVNLDMELTSYRKLEFVQSTGFSFGTKTEQVGGSSVFHFNV